MDGDLSDIATGKQLTRFNRSNNHPDILGLKARHAVANDDPPPDPLDIGEAIVPPINSSALIYLELFGRAV
jgi:hypothetical protein